MSWTAGPLLGFDLETDSPSPFEALPCSYAFVPQGREQDVDPDWHRQLLVARSCRAAIDIHGINTNERAQARGYAA